MCGIFALLGVDPKKTSKEKLHQFVAECSHKLQHRGPDWSGIEMVEYDVVGGKLQAAIAHQRLQIIDPYGGEQPITNEDYILAVNGEIYNYKELLLLPELQPYLHEMTTKSDCEVIIPLYKHFKDPKIVNSMLKGVFSYILYDKTTQEWIISRDAIGVNPLYYGKSEYGEIVVSSEIKAMQTLQMVSINEMPPGHFILSYMDRYGPPQRWYFPKWNWKMLSTHKMLNFNNYLPGVLEGIREGLINSVKRRLMSDAPYGFLLSGGLDSSLVCSIAAKLLKENPSKFGDKITTFSIGQKGSPDLMAAKMVSYYLGTNHYNFEFTVDQGIAAIPEVIYHVETFDVTTVRASTPLYLLARRIKALGFKMVMSGEGADELFGGYLYFHKAPSPEEFFDETVDKVNLLHKYDCKRANKATAAWGVEVRVPFLDKDFVDFVMQIDPLLKMINKSHPMEKWILRKAFEGYLPDEILWRQKEQFSDGVGYSWIDGIKDKVKDIPDRVYEKKQPLTKEAQYYRRIFEKRLPHPKSIDIVPWSRSVACSTERALKWDEEWEGVDEPSGRAVKVHESSY